MSEKTYKCAYPHCLHHGEPIQKSESVVDKGKHYHWDCMQLKKDLGYIRKIYIEHISDNAPFNQIAKVLNDLVFKENFDVDYVKFVVCYVASSSRPKNSKIKSPFSMLSIAKYGNGIRDKYEKNSDWWWEYFNRQGIT